MKVINNIDFFNDNEFLSINFKEKRKRKKDLN